MPKRFLILDLATGAVDAAITAAVESAIAASVASNIVKITVDDEASRYALTPAQVQNGDFVYQTDTTILYEVIDQTQLNAAAGYVALATVTAAQISDASTAGRALLTGTRASVPARHILRSAHESSNAQRQHARHRREKRRAAPRGRVNFRPPPKKVTCARFGEPAEIVSGVEFEGSTSENRRSTARSIGEAMAA